MRILFISGELIGSAICHQLLKEGHEVLLYVERDGWKKCLDGIVLKTDNWRDKLNWVGKDGLIIFDDVGFGEDQNKLRKEGYRVVGGSQEADDLELDRSFFHKILEEHGIPVLPSRDFDNIDDAILYIQENPTQWVVKQNSHYGVLNYVGEREDGADAIEMLHSYKEYGLTAHLQKRAFGIEIGVARYFNGTDWVGPIEVNHEHKRMCNGDIGPLTPEMGTIMWYSDDETLPLFTETLGKLKPYLQKIDFRGDFDINFIVNESGVWPLEAAARFGAPSTELQCELHNSPWYDFLSAIADGKQYDLDYSKEFGIVVSVAVPPYPYPQNSIDRSIFTTTAVQLFYKENIEDSDYEHIHLEEISKEKFKGRPDKYYWAGDNGWALHVTEKAPSITEARKKVYNIVNKIILPKMFYRTDIGTRVSEKDIPQLQKWKWI